MSIRDWALQSRRTPITQLVTAVHQLYALTADGRVWRAVYAEDGAPYDVVRWVEQRRPPAVVTLQDESGTPRHQNHPQGNPRPLAVFQCYGCGWVGPDCVQKPVAGGQWFCRDCISCGRDTE